MTADVSGHGLTGTLNGPVWRPGKFGNALRFNGDGDRVTIPDAPALHLTTAMTLSAWVYPRDAVVSWSTIALKETDGNLAYALYSGSDEGIPAAYLQSQGNAERVTGGASLPARAWSHLAATYDGSTFRLYVNGSMVSSSSLTASIDSSTGPLQIGANSIWGESFGGLIDEVRIYDRALSEAELATDMNVAIGPAGPPPKAQLVAAYGFEEGAGATANDTTDNHLAGTVTGAVWARGKFGNALMFNGGSDWVTVPDADKLDLTRGMTISAWINPSAPPPVWPTVLMKETDGNIAYGLYAHSDQNEAPAAFAGGFGAQGSSAVPIRAWTHLAGTFDGLTLRLYVNGALAASNEPDWDLPISDRPLRIGGNAIWNSEYFGGLIDEVRVYDGPLTAAELVEDMNRAVAPAGPTLPLVIGEPTMLTVDEIAARNKLLAQETVLNETATIQSLSLRVTTAAGQVRMAIYDATGPDGGPGAKKAETAAVTAAVGWTMAPVITPVSLSPGTYWLTYLASATGLHVRRFNSGAAASSNFTFGAMPASFPASPTLAQKRWSLYATLTGGAPGPCSSVVCTASDPCHVAGTCDPATGQCSNPNATDGTTCSDSNACTVGDHCQTGLCVSGTAVALDDGNPCTTDACTPAGGVTHAPVSAGTSCSDGNACNGAETCNASGACVAGTPVTCTALDTCHAVGTCDPSSGACSNPNATDGTSCSDSNACTVGDNCQTGVCVSGTPVALDDGNPCTTDACTPAGGVAHTPVTAGTSCSDGNACNGAETCNASGACVAGTAVAVDDGNPCTTDACTPAGGVTHAPVTAGTSCSDGNACNGAETCNASGACVAGTPVAVDDGNPCTTDACTPAGGVTHAPVTAGTSCSDGNACNGAETCNASGACVAGTPVTCTALDICHAVGTCDPSSGACSNPPALDGTVCDDGNGCTHGDTCQTGACVGSSPVNCTALDQCHTPGTCDPATGTCSNPTLPDETPCGDGDNCTAGDACREGVCRAGAPVAVDDGNACTADRCDPLAGVVHTAVASGTSCADAGHPNLVCDAQGHCVASACAAEDDGNPCTVDGCDPGTGAPTHSAAPAGTSCSDGNQCNGAETCDGSGHCANGSRPVWNDHNECTVDWCDRATGMHHVPVPFDPLLPKTCSAGCYVGRCNEAGTCVPFGGTFTDVGAPCSTNDPCRDLGTCDASGACVPGPPLEGQSCSTNSCDYGTCDAQGRCQIDGYKPSGSFCPDSSGRESSATDCNGDDACNDAGICESGPARPDGTVVEVRCSFDPRLYARSSCLDGITMLLTERVPDDGNSCTNDTCSTQCAGGSCTAQFQHGAKSSGTACDASSDPCRQKPGTCNGTATCISDPSNEAVSPRGTSCGPGDVCTGTGHVCDGAGQCLTMSLGADDHDPCTADICNRSQLTVTHPLRSKGFECGPGNVCGGTGNICNEVGQCVTASIVLDDHNACTIDVCDLFAMTATHFPLSTDDGNPCTVDACDPVLGQSHTASVGIACSNGHTDRCQYTAATCNAEGQCVDAPVVLDDNNPCTFDFCDSTFGVGHVPLDVDDGNPCTIDRCNPLVGVTHDPSEAGTSCVDGNPCNGIEICNGQGTCLAGRAPEVDDNNVCTIDSCGPTGVVHAPAPLGTPCRDADLCNGNEACNGAGQCAAGPAPIIDDSNACTIDGCSPIDGVSHVMTGDPTCLAQRSTWAGTSLHYPPRDSLSFAHDDSMGRLVMFGGLNNGVALADTWIWDRATRGWSLSRATGPSARAGASMGYDRDRQRIVLFGGAAGRTGEAPYYDDVWEYDTLADRWEARTSNTPSPGPRAYASFAYDTALRTFVLFGGVTRGGMADLADTWQWDGATGRWTQRAPSASPSARAGAAMAYDAARGRFVLFGGGPLAADRPASVLGDTWEFDNALSVWTQRTAGASPPRRTAHAMVYDETNQRVVLFGGTGESRLALGDTWEYDGLVGQWTATTVPDAPGPRAGHAMAYSSVDHAVWVAGGLAYSPSGEFTSEYDDLWKYRRGDGWTSVGSRISPAVTTGPMVFDTTRHRFVLRGAGLQALTWELDAANGRWDARMDGSEQADWGRSGLMFRNASTDPFVFDTDRNRAVLFEQQRATKEALWEWDGRAWTRRNCPGGPPGLEDGDVGRLIAGTYDSIRHRFVFYRGDFGEEFRPDQYRLLSDNVYDLDTTTCSWEWRQPETAPTHVRSANLAFDSDRGRVLFFSGQSRETWEWDGASNVWTQRVTANTPPARRGAAFLYDPVRKRAVLFGGAVGAQSDLMPTTFFGDTWEFDPAAGVWEEKHPARSPSAREKASVGFDPDRGRIVLHGGARGSVLLGGHGLLTSSTAQDRQFDLWEWDGSNWQSFDFGSSPPARDGVAAAFVPQQGFGVLFGGVSGDGQRDYLQDTWVYRNGAWALVSSPTLDNSPRQFGTSYGPSGFATSGVKEFTSKSPPGRAGHALAAGFRFDGVDRGIALLFGGEGDAGLLSDSWTWDDATFTWKPYDAWYYDPPARRDHALSTLPGIGFLMFGGQNAKGEVLADTWTWQGGTWINRTQWYGMSIAPPARRNFAMATDLDRRRVVLFGGRNETGALADTWEFDFTDPFHWQRRNPEQSPPARWGHQLVYDSARKKVLLTGGIGRNPDALIRDTWEWDGEAGTWTIRKPAIPLEPRAGHASFFDATNGIAVVLGGLSHREGGRSAMAFGDVWTFQHPELSAGESPSLPNGVRCNGNANCESGLCVDGVCCSSRCESQCAACDAPGFEGTCSPVTGPPHGARATCGPVTPCGSACNGSDMNACHITPAGTRCLTAGCSNGSVHSEAYCDGNGACAPPAQNTSCEPYACTTTDGCQCASPQACVEYCFVDANCFSPAYACVVRGFGLAGRDQGDCKRRAVLQSVAFEPPAARVGQTFNVVANVTSPDPDLNFKVTDPSGVQSNPCSQVRSSTGSCSFVPTHAGAYVWKVEAATFRGVFTPFAPDDTRTMTIMVAP